MTWILDEQRRMLRDSAQNFFTERAPVSHLRALRDADDADGHSPALWRAFAEQGYSATLVPEREELMGRIGDALALAGGQVLVTGHTDNSPIRSARFPSNWHLSEARARSVRDLLITHSVPANRVQAEGRADSEPLVANDSASNRAMNRRVEVTLMVGRGAAAPSGAKAASKP